MVCNKCNETKTENDFAWHSKANGIRRKICRLCTSQRDKEAYQNSQTRRDGISVVRTARRNGNLRFIRDYLRKNPCVDCGESNIIVLEFDHVRDKLQNVTTLARIGASIEKLSNEISKCEVRCANCHRKKTYERGGWNYADIDSTGSSS